MSQFHFEPESYAETIRAELPWYDELQERLARAVAGPHVDRILDLGAGTGATTASVRAEHPGARVVAVDESEGMLAEITLDDVQTVVARLQDPLPAGPFDLVVSALAVHHLDPAEKRDLFARVHAVLRPGGRFVLGDLVLADVALAPVTDGYDKPDSAADQVEWLRAAGFDAHVLWERDDAALIAADRT